MTERKTAPAKKAPAKKAPAKKAPAKKAPAKKASAETAPAETTGSQDQITFRDRKIQVRMPSPEQVLVWQRTMKQLQDASLNDWNGAQVLAALERCRKIIDSVIVNKVDVDWVDDEMLAGRFGLKEAAQIILDALELFQNRAGRRAAAKKTPARRKKAAS